MTKHAYRLLILFSITIIFCIVFVSLSQCTEGSSLPGEEKNNDQGLQKNVVLELSPKEISYIRFSSQTKGEILFQKLDNNNEIWSVAGYNYPLDQERIIRLLDIVSELKASWLHNEQVDLAIYGLSEPYMTVEIGLFNNEKKRIIFGRTSVIGEKVYMQIDGDSRIYFLSQEERNIFSNNLDDYWNVGLPSFDWENISHMRVETSRNVIDLKVVESSQEATLYTFVSPSEYKGLLVNSQVFKTLWDLWIKSPFYKDQLRVKINSWKNFGLDAPDLQFFLTDKDNNEMVLCIGHPVNGKENYRFARLNNEDAVFIIDENYLKPFFDLRSFDVLEKQIIHIPQEKISFFLLQGYGISSQPFVAQIIDTERVHEEPFTWNNFVLQRQKSKNVDKAEIELKDHTQRFDYRVNGYPVVSSLFLDLYLGVNSLKYKKEITDIEGVPRGRVPFFAILLYGHDMQIMKKIELYSYDKRYCYVILDGIHLKLLVSYDQIHSIIESIQKITYVTENK